MPPEEVVLDFDLFLATYKLFREDYELDNSITNIHEILTAMTDKHGRICRYIKHQERNDPKDNWQEGMSMALTGYLVYAILLFEHYGIDTREGMIKELSESIKQHGGK